MNRPPSGESPGEHGRGSWRRRYVRSARSARANLPDLIITPFVLWHLAFFVGVDMVIGSVVGALGGSTARGAETGFAGGVALGLSVAGVSLMVTAIHDRWAKRVRR